MLLVIELGRAMRAFPFKTLWWKIGLVGKVEVGQTVAYRDEREGIPAILTANHPVRHTDLLQAQSGWRYRGLEYTEWCIGL